MLSITQIRPDVSIKTASAPSTLVELLQARAYERVGRGRYTFLSDGETAEVGLSYGELDKQARAIGTWLQSLGQEGKPVLLLYPPGLEFIGAFFGCLYAGAIAVPAYPPRMNQKLDRLKAIAADTGATLVLTTAAILEKTEPLLSQLPYLDSLRWLATDRVATDLASLWREPKLRRDTLAFLQYTSGSTGTPKGVMLAHENLLYNATLVYSAVEHTPEDMYVSWLPTFHDMGFMAGVLQPLYAGIPVVLMPPSSFLQRPARWLQAISRYGATTSGGPNFAYELCAGKVSQEDREGLDLSSWSVAFNGAEPIRKETLERFSKVFGPCGFRRQAFYPCYGLAEATLIVSGGLKAAAPADLTVQAAALEKHQVIEAAEAEEGVRTLVDCGGDLPGQEILIVDPQSMTRCRPGEVGEIWVSGPSVARGYWNNPAETAATFQARLADTNDGPFMRTGDLGFSRDGKLFVTGRMKDLIIIRGRNHYPQDIELTAENCHPALRPGGGAAFSVEVAGEERLVIVHEVTHRPQSDLTEVLERIRQAVAEEHELQLHAAVLIKAGSIFKTSSGKIQRRACRAAFFGGTLETLAQWQHPDAPEGAAADVVSFSPSPAAEPEGVEAWLLGQVAAKLGVAPAQIAHDQPLTRYGLDSLAATELMHAIETGLGVSMPMASFLQSPSIADLAARVRTSLAERPAGASAAPTLPRGKAVRHPLSYGQKALWFLHQLAPENPAYNVASALQIRQRLDAAALRRAFQSLVDRHPSLRTTFDDAHGEPAQTVTEHVEVCFGVEDASGQSRAALDRRLVEESRRPFDLKNGPLLRATLFVRSEESHILLLTMHHIITDLWSLAVLVDELGALYAAEKNSASALFPPPASQYEDYVRWQAETVSGPAGQRHWEYWREQLSGELPALELYGGRVRPPVQTYDGASHTFAVEAETTRALKELARGNDATLYMVLLAAFQVLLGRYTGLEDIAVGSPTSGRARADFKELVGYLVNPVVLRADLSGDPSFETFLGRVRHSVLEAFEHQDYPFALLVERLQPVRDASRPPLVQVMFALQKTQTSSLGSLASGKAGARVKLGELELEAWPLEQQIAQFDLTLMVAEDEDGLAATLQYNTDLYEAETAARLCSHFLNLLRDIAARPSAPVGRLSLLPDDERRRLLRSWSRSRPTPPAAACLHHLFEAQARATPDALAVAAADASLSYAELDGRAGRLAARLRALGVGPESLVGVCMRRSASMVVALLGALKAGAAYVPLDPGYPGERLRQMVEDAGVRVVVGERGAAGWLAGVGARVLLLGEGGRPADEAEAGERDEEPVWGVVSPENLAYVIYTSGSTGKPKGVKITHASLGNLLGWHLQTYGITEADRASHVAGVSFDASVWEVWPYLVRGASLHIPDESTRLSPPHLRDWLISNGITHCFLPTPLAESILALDWPAAVPLKVLLTGGDRLHRYPPAGLDFELVNHYGPSECTVVATSAPVPPKADANRMPPIGRAISNVETYVLDDLLEPVPTGAVGHLHLAGRALARGYLRRPALTAERFIPHPFSSEPGARLYRTGDAVRFLPGGELEYVGRFDRQVKVRGFRIELGEIEAALAAHEQVAEAAVLARPDSPGEPRLVAYLVPRRGETPSPAQLRGYLREKLPDYMVPAHFVVLGVMPLTPNGKLDRRALPAPASGGEHSAGYVEPRTETERAVARVWSEVLGVGRVGADDNFFELGGHSLLATQVVSRVRECFSAELPVRSLFETPKLSEFAEVVETAKKSQAEAQVSAVVPLARSLYRAELSSLGALAISEATKREL